MQKKVSKYIKQSKKHISITKKREGYIYHSDLSGYVLYVSDCTVHVSPRFLCRPTTLYIIARAVRGISDYVHVYI